MYPWCQDDFFAWVAGVYFQCDCKAAQREVNNGQQWFVGSTGIAGRETERLNEVLADIGFDQWPSIGRKPRDKERAINVVHGEFVRQQYSCADEPQKRSLPARGQR